LSFQASLLMRWYAPSAAGQNAECDPRARHDIGRPRVIPKGATVLVRNLTDFSGRVP
jgi:hypothetical protein